MRVRYISHLSDHAQIIRFWRCASGALLQPGMGPPVTPTCPEHVLLAAEIVLPGSGTIDRIVKGDQYAHAD